jgi:hypothetical protein
LLKPAHGFFEVAVAFLVIFHSQDFMGVIGGSPQAVARPNAEVLEAAVEEGFFCGFKG